VSIVCGFLKRPLKDFVGGRRVADRLRHCSKRETAQPLRGHIDNLAKFLLVAISSPVYADDCRVVDLHLGKIRIVCIVVAMFSLSYMNFKFKFIYRWRICNLNFFVSAYVQFEVPGRSRFLILFGDRRAKRS
jgi:hypothetical protein